MQFPRNWLRFELFPPGNWLIAAISISLMLSGCNLPNRSSSIPKIQLEIRNSLPIERKDVSIVLSVAELRAVAPDFAPDAYVIADPASSGEHLPSQVEDTNYDGEMDALVFLVDMQPEQTRQFVIHYDPGNMHFTLGYDKRTRAGIFPELEGAVCESELAAYRLMDGPVVDVLGKPDIGFQTNRWVKEQADQIRLPSLLGTSTAGCGSFRLWDKDIPTSISSYERVLTNGPVRSTVQFVNTTIRGDLSVYAGQPWLEYHIYSGTAEVAAMLPGNSRLVRNEADGFVYTWGKQTTYEPEDQLGLALFYPQEQLISIEEHLSNWLVSEPTHYLRLKPDKDGYVVYRVLTAWDHGHEGISDEQAFIKYLKTFAESFQNPLAVQLSLPEKTDRKR